MRYIKFRHCLFAGIVSNGLLLSGCSNTETDACTELVKHKQYLQAHTLCSQQAAKGDSSAEHQLGILYENGLGTSIDFETAITWYRKAAEHGNADAQSSLAWMHYFGRGTVQDSEAAEQWFNKAVALGSESAGKNLAAIQQAAERSRLAPPGLLAKTMVGGLPLF